MYENIKPLFSQAKDTVAKQTNQEHLTSQKRVKDMNRQIHENELEMGKQKNSFGKIPDN